MKLSLFFLLLFSNATLANNFCTRTNLELKELLIKQSSRLDFPNTGGLFGGGVCWWHSRLQRSSIYLAKFRPELPRPTPEQASRILKHLRNMDQVVEIPGFSNFRDFSRTYQKTAQQTLNSWQRLDGFINQEWIRGLSGRSSLAPSMLEKKMDEIFQVFNRSPVPIWLMAQMKGVVAHAFLVIEMKKVLNGFELSVIDSNRPTITRLIKYQLGSHSLNVFGDSYQFVPYTGFQNDFSKLKSAVNRHCGFKMAKPISYPLGDIEIGD